MIDFVPAFFEIVFRSTTVIIDEIGRSIHPYLLKRLLARFMDSPSTGQLVFTTHEAHLLDQAIFRQDEIWFVEKKPTGESSFYPLSEFNIRYDLDLRKGYLNGRFGAIPFLANMEDINWNPHAKKK